MSTVLLATKAPTFDLSAVVVRAKQIDPTLGSQLEVKIQSGEIGIVEFDQPTVLGVHDHNTIGLNARYGTLVCAIALLHEYQHILHCNGPLGGGGTGGDDRVTQPCYPCEHMQMNAESWEHLSAWYCELDDPSSTGALQRTICEARKALELAAKRQAIRCFSTCTGYPSFELLAYWSQPCPNCP